MGDTVEHKCNVCQTLFKSARGLQQHVVLHTGARPFQCDICSKSFAFKSNLLEHRSVHSGLAPYACPYCGKTCRLKGNLKKHLKTHVTTRAELEAAWRPFASNRNYPNGVFTPQTRKKRRNGGRSQQQQQQQRQQQQQHVPHTDYKKMTARQRAQADEEKIRRLEASLSDHVHNADITGMFEVARTISYETHACPVCNARLMTRADVDEHMRMIHRSDVGQLPYFCEKCYRGFADAGSFEQHRSYHNKVHELFREGALEQTEPKISVPNVADFSSFGLDFRP